MDAGSDLHLAPVRSRVDLDATIALFRAYASSLDVDLCFQGFEDELAALPGKYAPPRGELLLARNGSGTAVGCVALRPLERHGCCEMKRLYVSPEGRGFGLGETLVRAIVQEARRIGYADIWLDTLPSMTAAIALYRKLGFEPMDPYYDTPVAGTVFMHRILDRAVPARREGPA